MAAETVDLTKQFNVLREKLLDLTMRNQLLNFRPRTRVIKVVDEISTEIYEILVLKEKSMEFKPKKEKLNLDKEFQEKELVELSEKESDILWELPSPSKEVAEKHQDRYLQTNLNSKDLQKRLFRIHQQAKTVLDEQGYNVLYLALGMLEWCESKNAIAPRLAPLILIPVELRRTKVKRAFKLEWTNDDIITNISLKAKLEEQGVEIPDFSMPDTKEGIFDYFKSVEKSISSKKKWKLRHEIYLGFFSFTKFVMYQDLDPSKWPDSNFVNNPIINSIFNPSEENNFNLFNENDVDIKIPSKKTFTVLDADSSQIAAIEDAKSKKNLVVEGPPGTGKSQTIVNLIAELIAMNKTVLFVSEKMAALEVVKNRMDNIGLGDYCLELHSRKSNKKMVLNELERTLSSTKNNFKISEEEYDVLDDLKSDLNLKMELIHENINKTGFSPFQLFGMKEEGLFYFEQKNKSLPSFEIKNILDYDKKNLDSAISTLNNLIKIYSNLKPLSILKYKYSNPEIILPADQEEIGNLIQYQLKKLKSLKNNLQILSKKAGIKIPKNKIEFASTVEFAFMIADAEIDDKEILDSSEWDQENNKALDIIKKLKSFHEYSSKFHLEAVDYDINKLILDFNPVRKRLDLSSKKLMNNESGAKESIDFLLKDLNNLQENIENLDKLTGISIPNTRYELDESLEISKIISETPITDQHVLSNSEWDATNPDASKLIVLLKDFKEKDLFLSKFTEDTLERDLSSIHERFSKLMHKRLKFLSGDYKKNKKLIQSLYLTDSPDEDMVLLSDLELLIKCKDLKGSIHESESLARRLFGSKWNAEKTNPETLEELSNWLINFRTLLKKGKISSKSIESISLETNHWKIKEISSALIENLKSIDNNLNSAKKIFNLSFQPDFQFIELKKEFNDLKFNLKKYLDIRYEIASLYVESAPDDDLALLSDLEHLIKCKDLKGSIHESESLARRLFGSKWNAEKTDPEELEKLSKWLINFRKLLKEGKITPEAIDLISTGTKKTEIKEVVETISKNYEEFLDGLNKLNKFLNMDYDSLFQQGLDSTDFDEFLAIFENFNSNFSKLNIWSQFNLIKNENNPLISPIITLLEEDSLEVDEIILVLKANFAENFLKELFVLKPDLMNFVGDFHESKIQEFVKLDKELMIKNKFRILNNVNQNIPQTLISSPNSEIGILKREFNRKRKHMPIRQLLNHSGGFIQKIKPCFMMSPLSIAQFIDPQSVENMKFDIIIFDEASQVKPEDALGALMRGNQLVLMGDTKQLPPTTFFDTMIESSEEEYELSSLADIESILHLCKPSFPTKTLKWHYRSRHESLIAVSNQEFYDNQLFIYPSPCHNSKNLGLKFVHLQDAVYDRGRSSVNRLEAEMVVKAAFRHYNKYGNSKTLGIGTFNIKQQQAILEILELELRQNPSMERYFSNKENESFFVKNLETIQGDERDVIFISVGYGFDQNGKLYKNFGPLNQAGGERRLNVLASRAREKCVVFSNFTYRDLDISPTSPFGLQSLKIFLEYAETKNLKSISTPLEETDSPFEDSVYEFLKGYGFEVHKQVGCAGFRIDLAIIDPENRGRYLLGIECDGAMYHSSKVARDRDRLRQQILENLGWKIYRIWSTDWYRNRPESIRKLLSAIENSKNYKISSSSLKSDEDNYSNFIEEVDVVEIEQQDYSDIDGIACDYEICDSLGANCTGNLLEKDSLFILGLIKNIVEIEGPVHMDEVIRRIRTLWGLKRSTPKLKKTIINAYFYNSKNSGISCTNDFLYLKDGKIKVRKRKDNPKPQINLISESEISEAVLLVLKYQHATPRDEVVTAVARLLGFKSTRKNVSVAIEKIVDKLFKEKKIVELPNGTINLPK